MTEHMKQQIIKVRDASHTNMLDFQQVRCIAQNMELPELVDFIERHSEEYVAFILTGVS